MATFSKPDAARAAVTVDDTEWNSLFDCWTVGDLAEWLDAVRQSRGLSRRAVSREIDKSPQQTNELFNGALVTVSAQVIRRIGQCLRLSEPQLDDLERVRRTVCGGDPQSPVDVVAYVPPLNETFVGRDRLLRDIGEQVRRREARRLPVLVCIDGAGGIGKTELAKHVARMLIDTGDYREQYFVDMHGNDAHRSPSVPEKVSARLLTLLGDVDGVVSSMPLKRKAARLQHKLAETRSVLVFDNCADERQILPMLPSISSCAIVVTTRRRMDRGRSAMFVTLRPLDVDDAVALLRDNDPHGLVESDPDNAERIVRLCHRSPIELQQLAANLRAPDKAHWTLGDHANRLENIHRQLGRDENIRHVLAGSYQRLEPQSQRVFRFMALHPGANFAVHDAAAMCGLPLEQTDKILTGLADETFLQQPRPGRFQYHDIYSDYARRLRIDHDTEGDLNSAVSALHRFYLATARSAMHRIAPFEADLVGDFDSGVVASPRFSDAVEARAWLDTERGHMIAAADLAAERSDFANALSTVLHTYLDQCGYWTDAKVLLTLACEVSDDAAKGNALQRLADVNGQLGLYEEAVECCRQALDIARRLNEPPILEGRRLGSLGMLYRRIGRFDDALEQHHQALQLARRHDLPHNEALAMHSLGIVHGRIGRYTEALEYLESAVQRHDELDDHAHYAYALGSIGLIKGRQGELTQAFSYHRQALRRFSEHDNLDGMGHARHNLGNAHRDSGEYDTALTHYATALEAFDTTGNRADRAEILNDRGYALHASGEPTTALEAHGQARWIAETVGDRYQIARAANGTAHLAATAGQGENARKDWQEALEIFAEINAPEAVRVKQHLSECDNPAAAFHPAVHCCLTE